MTGPTSTTTTTQDHSRDDHGDDCHDEDAHGGALGEHYDDGDDDER